MSVAVFFAPHPALVPYFAFIDKVNEQAKGELIIQHVGGPEAISMFEQGFATVRGVVQMAFVWQGAYAGVVPTARVNYLSKMSAAEEEKRGVIALLRKVHADSGLYFLGKPRDLDPAGLFFLYSTKKKIEKPQDLAGLKIGSESGATVPAIKSLGGIPVILPTPEVFPALERGVVDYWITTPTSLVFAFSGHQLVKYKVDYGFYQDATAFLFNLDAWNRIPPHLQKLMQDIHKELQQEALADFTARTQAADQTTKDAGVEFVKWSEEDGKWFVDTIHNYVWDEIITRDPDIGKQFYKLIEGKEWAGK